jgi:hypothetical protein
MLRNVSTEVFVFSQVLALLPVVFLLNLRQAVIEHSDHRMPKWKFRVAPELIVLLQPSVRLVSAGTILELFKGEALQTSGPLTEQMFASAAVLNQSGLNFWRIKFALTAPAQSDPRSADWTYAHRGGSWKAGAGRPGYDALKACVESLFLGGFFDTMDASKLLFPHCLICGKRLTDPASMARFIGPECAGTASLDVPRMIIKPNAQGVSSDSSTLSNSSTPSNQEANHAEV